MTRRVGKMGGKNRTRRILARLSCALLGCLVTAVAMPAQTLSEYDVEAAYLYNFGKFVRWPAGALAGANSFDICILGQDPFGGTLDRLIAQDQIEGKPIHRRVIAHAAEAAGCAIVYISDSEEANRQKILSALNGKGYLLVSGLPHFVEDGGTIQFSVQENRVRFEINLDAASKNRLVLSSELLKVALSVTGKRQSGVTP